jgi:transcriptional regulator with XRE-family HTH domain
MGERLRRTRDARGLSQDALADQSGVSKTQISNCERGKRGLGPKALFAVARALGVRPQWLHDGEEPMVRDGALDSSELERAVTFLRGQLPDAFLDDVLVADFYHGEAWTRDQLVPMIRAAYAERKRAGDRDDTDEAVELMSNGVSGPSGPGR